MKVKIENKLYIESDDMNYTVKEYTGKFDKADPSKELFKVHGYHATLKHAVEKVIRMKITKSTATSLKELLSDIKRIEKEVHDLINA